MNKYSALDLLHGERVLFYSPTKDRWENYRFDLMAYIVIGMGIVPYTITLFMLFSVLGLFSYFKAEISLVERYFACIIFIFASLGYMFITMQYIIALKAYKNNYPLVLTNKRIILERDFLKKKKPIGTFIEGAEKVAYIEVTKRVAYVYFKKDGKIKKVPISYLSKYREDFKNALNELFGDRYVEIILREENIPLNKELIEDIFRDEQKGGIL